MGIEADHVFIIHHEVIRKELSLSPASIELVEETRNNVRRILDGEDSRMIAIVGPCSIYGEEATIEYASRLKKIAYEVRSKLLVIMRYCVAKPRTNGGWKGLFTEPNLLKRTPNDINEGAWLSRKIATNLLDLGMPLTTEVLDHLMIEYLDDLVSHAWIGARTVATPLLRAVATGLSMPIGMKNDTRGDITPALDAMTVARKEGWRFGVRHGRPANIRGGGNSHPHLILRGGRIAELGIGNYSQISVESARRTLKERKLPERVIVDCSHDNSNKDYRLQKKVLFDLVRQRNEDSSPIAGFMLESNLREGRQDVPAFGAPKPGISLTDGCIGIEETERILLEAANRLP